MTKLAHDDMIDGALNIVKNNANLMAACIKQPSTREEAVSTYALADAAMASGDFTLADGDTSGRKATVAAKNGVPVDATGMATHIALCDATRLLYVTELGTVRQETAQAGSGNTITLDTGASSVDDFYDNMALTIVEGEGAGQTRYITSYVGSTKVATVDATWSTQPNSTSVFRIYGQQLTSGNTVDFPAWKIEIADPA